MSLAVPLQSDPEWHTSGISNPHREAIPAKKFPLFSKGLLGGFTG